MASALPKIVTLLALMLMGWTVAVAGPLDLTVIYPRDSQYIAPVDSTFIFGSVQPGSAVWVNDHSVPVHKDGGWLAFIPVRPGEFTFKIIANNRGNEDKASITVFSPDFPISRTDSLYIDSGTIQPFSEMWVKPGDRIGLAFRGTPECLASCRIEPLGLTVPMIEKAPRSFYINRDIYDSTGLQLVPDSMLVRGEYAGTFIVPETDANNLRLTYSIVPSLPVIMRTYFRYWLENTGSPPSSGPFLTDNPVEIKILPHSVQQVVELKDSISIIRTGPGKGYATIHQPAGVRALLAGKDGRWLKLQLSDYQFGWIIDTAGVILPPGNVTEQSNIRLIETHDSDDKVTVRIETSGKHPFRVEENIAENSLTLYIYGATADTDWIRYDNRDDLIDHAVWSQPEPGLFKLKLFLETNPIWGYDAHYIGPELYLDLMKRPYSHHGLRDFHIVLDPGHSPDRGAVGPTGLEEREVNLWLAQEIKKALEREGARVTLTRNDMSPLALYDRPKIAVAEKADLFISVHNNAVADGVNPLISNGISTYYYHPHSQPMAEAVQKAMIRNIDLPDFGLYYGNLAVNRPTQYPAILIECAFMMIPEQEALLKKKSFRKKIAESVVEGIKDFLRGRSLTDWDRRQAKSYGRSNP